MTMETDIGGYCENLFIVVGTVPVCRYQNQHSVTNIWEETLITVNCITTLTFDLVCRYLICSLWLIKLMKTIYAEIF